MDLIPLIGMIICFLYLPKRTDFGNEMLSKIIRFKNFLEIAEKDNLEGQVSKNPTYFYDILPYTYIFEISDTLVKLLLPLYYLKVLLNYFHILYNN